MEARNPQLTKTLATAALRRALPTLVKNLPLALLEELALTEEDIQNARQHYTGIYNDSTQRQLQIMANQFGNKR